MEYKIQIFSTSPVGEPSFSGVLYKDAEDRVPPDASGSKSKGSTTSLPVRGGQAQQQARGPAVGEHKQSPSEVMPVTVNFFWLVRVPLTVMSLPCYSRHLSHRKPSTSSRVKYFSSRTKHLHLLYSFFSFLIFSNSQPSFWGAGARQRFP